MNIEEIIKTRRSVRTFDGKNILPEHKEKLCAYIKTIENPYDIPVEFVLLDAKEYGLSSPVIKGDTLYVAAKSPKIPHSEEAFGFSFEKLVLYAWSLGIGTTWIGGTMNRERFEKAAEVKENERMICVSPLGYPAEKMSIKEIAMRKGVKADIRKTAEELFFDGDFSKPLEISDKKIENALEMVRYSPSAVNMQPWRIVKDGNDFHFYVKHNKGYISEKTGDLQKVDMGIALCHFMSVTDGKFVISDPYITAQKDIEYIATVIL